MARPPPMPIELVVDHPQVIALPNAAWHAVLALCVIYWRAECRPLPKANHDLAALAHSDVATFGRNCYVITSALETLAPILSQRRSEELAKAANRRRSASRAAVASNAAQRAKRANQPVHTPIPEPPQEPLGRLAKAPRYAPAHGKTDMASRRAAIARTGHVRPGGMVDVTADGGDAGARALAKAGSGRGLLADSAPLPSPLTPDELTSAAVWSWQPDPTPPPTPDREAA